MCVSMSAPRCAACGGDPTMCNLYCLTKGQQAIRELAGVMRDRTGNLPLLPGIYPNYRAPIVRNQPEGRELTMARWGRPSPMGALIEDLDRRGMRTKAVAQPNGRVRGGIRFGVGPLAHLLKNRLYIGEVVFPGRGSRRRA